MTFLLLTQKPMKAFFRKTGNIGAALREGIGDLTEGLITGVRNMIGLAAAMGVAGIIVGAVTLTGIGQVMGEHVEFLSGGNLLAMLFFAAGTMGYFLTRSRFWESAALIGVALILFRPALLLDQVQPEFTQMPTSAIFKIAEAAPDNADIGLRLESMDFTGKDVSSTYQLPLGAKGPDGASRLATEAGLELIEQDGDLIVDNVNFASLAEEAGIDFDWIVPQVQTRNDRMPKEVFYIPAFLLIGLVAYFQRRRTPNVVSERVTPLREMSSPPSIWRIPSTMPQS